jgi:hypothetical protein
VDETTVITFPHNDAAFAAYVQQRSRRCRTPHDLQTAVRDWYPRAAVSARSSLAGYGDQCRVWYAYRDGTPRSKDSGRWWTESGVAEVAFGRDGLFVAANVEATALCGRTSRRKATLRRSPA